MRNVSTLMYMNATVTPAKTRCHANLTPHMPCMAFFFLRSQQLVDALEEQQSVGGLYDCQTFSATSTVEYNERSRD